MDFWFYKSKSHSEIRSGFFYGIFLWNIVNNYFKQTLFFESAFRFNTLPLHMIFYVL